MLSDSTVVDLVEWHISGTPLTSTAKTTTALARGGKSVFMELIEAADLHASSRAGSSGVGWIAA